MRWVKNYLNKKNRNFELYYYCFSESYSEAKIYAKKKRPIFPMDYCESQKRKKCQSKPKGHQKHIADLKENIKVKSEHLSLLKRAVRILNRAYDKKNIDNVDEMDLQEYDDLIDAGSCVPQNMEVFGTSQSLSNEETDDDCVVVGAGSRTRATRTNAITEGVGEVELQIDKDFSLEYSYTTDVSWIERISNLLISA